MIEDTPEEAAIDPRLAFDHLLARVEELEAALDGDREVTLRAGSDALPLLGEAMKIANQMSPEQQSIHHAEVMLKMATFMGQLGVATNEPARLEDALRRCDAALQLCVALGSPVPRLEAEGLFVRGRLLALLGRHQAGIDHLEEVVAVMEPAVEYLEALRSGGSPAQVAMLDLSREDLKARRLLDDAVETLEDLRATAAAAKPWWRFW